jgi:hypothetical protein
MDMPLVARLRLRSMVVNVSITKLLDGRVQVTVGKRYDELTQAQEFGSANEARKVLLEIGLPEEALELYFSQLFLCVPIHEKLVFPAIDIPEHELLDCWFRFARTG